MKKLLLSLMFLALPLKANMPTYHFLWVIDNSGSMAKQQQLLAQYFPKFLERLEKGGIKKYKMGITSTDYFEHKGHLYPPEFSAPALVTSEHKDPAEVFARYLSTVKTTPTSFWEQGLEASLQVLKTFPESFTVAGEPLVIIYISDEDDYSCKEGCTGTQPETNPNWEPFSINRYRFFFQDLKRKNIETSLFPIVGTLEGNCQVSSYGVRYLKLRSEMPFGAGIAGSVCEGDFVTSLMNVADKLTSPDIQAAPKWLFNPVVFSGDEDSPFVADLASLVTGHHLEFQLLSGPAWLSLSGVTGTLKGIPSKADLGINEAKVRATDRKGRFADVSVQIHIRTKNHPPLWKQNPIDLGNVKVGTAVTLNLARFVYDPDNDLISFRFIQLPNWASVSPGGFLTGTPKTSDIGSFSFKGTASDIYGGSSEATFKIKVVQ